jgi:hypothetical protein
MQFVSDPVGFQVLVSAITASLRKVAGGKRPTAGRAMASFG